MFHTWLVGFYLLWPSIISVAAILPVSLFTTSFFVLQSRYSDQLLASRFCVSTLLQGTAATLTFARLIFKFLFVCFVLFCLKTHWFPFFHFKLTFSLENFESHPPQIRRIRRGFQVLHLVKFSSAEPLTWDQIKIKEIIWVLVVCIFLQTQARTSLLII